MKHLKLTPMLEQYFEMKRQVGDAILFYRLGDFYEMFFEDAEKAAPILDLVLTARGKGGDSETPMCGVPYHSADQHIARLIRAGHRVAICEQIGDPSAAKGLVKREVVRIVTAGTNVEGSLLERDHCYLLAVAPSETGCGAAFLDVSTGDFFATTYASISDPRLQDDIARIAPREILVPDGTPEVLTAELRRSGVSSITAVEASFFETRSAHEFLTRHFATQTLRGFGLGDTDARIGAAGAALRYASSNHKKELSHVAALRLESGSDFLALDASTLQNLEVLEGREIGSRTSLWSVMNVTRTAMGARTLKKWLSRPLLNREAIFERHDAVDELTRNQVVLEELSTTLTAVSDLERLASRVTLRTASPRECLALADSLDAVDRLIRLTTPLISPLWRRLRGGFNPLPHVAAIIRATIENSPPPSIRDGGVIRSGVRAGLDELRSIARDSKSILLRIEGEERVRTGVGSLKIRFNSVFGYYIEISRANLAKVPADYIRKQTLVNAERFITPELKELEEKIVGAEEKSLAIEDEMYVRLLDEVTRDVAKILDTARMVGESDSLHSLASVALRRRYVRPVLSPAQEIVIQDGRHPVIEAISSERFIPNSTTAVAEQNGIQIITGPNMGGKSTYLRQVALIVLLNQAGSFVPASSATLGIFDRIFTRVGAADNLARGESTFMMEMHETANILNNATGQSLIVFDEVGRGTATFDGLSLAWAILEYLHDHIERSGITLFATHFHEVTDLAATRSRIVNFNVSVKEWNEQIVFLRKVVPGSADKSYGIQVAKLAGIPQPVIQRSREILRRLEEKERVVMEEPFAADGLQGSPGQMSLFVSPEQDVLRQLCALDLDQLSPIEALNKLNELKTRLTE